ncbi:hypothetical protein ABZ714_00435 [Streptomyces sp. NPDC006798]|uniref:hypothetical protein n=1 Tax=Streptomyces sp. NPDC006798 TaxID=3155462 RepID=UPI0033ED7F86
MTEPEQPHVVIVREQGGNVAAIPHRGFQRAEHGVLAMEMLRHAGFIDDHGPASRQYRLHWDMGREYENRQSTSAAKMLTAAGFRVDLDPSLDTELLATPSDPVGRLVHGQQLLRLTDRLNGAGSPAEAADVAEQVLDPVDGVLARLSEFFEAAVEQAKEAGTDEGWDLSYLFEDAAATVTALGEDLHIAADRMRALATATDQGREPGLHEAARAQSPTLTGRTVSPSPTPAAAPLPSAVPDRGRTR